MKTEDLRSAVNNLVGLYETIYTAKEVLKEETEKQAALLGLDKQILTKYVEDYYKGNNKKQAQKNLEYIDIFEGINPGDSITERAPAKLKVTI